MDRARELGMRVAYQEQLREWLGKGPWWRIKSWPNNARVLLLRAAAVAEELRVDPDEFMRAQFWWFNAVFNKRARLQDLATDNRAATCAERVREYQRAVVSGKINAKRAIKSPVRQAPKVPQSVKFAHCEQTLRNLMRNYDSTEEEILRVFAAGPQATMYFDRTWLQQNATYKRLKEAGEV
jgi:hypothetical protein